MTRIAIIYGGRSVEHGWSVGMYEHLRDVFDADLEAGVAVEAVVYLALDGTLYVARAAETGLPSHREVLSTGRVEALFFLPMILKQLDVFVFSLLQGQDGEDGQIQAIAQFLESREVSAIRRRPSLVPINTFKR
jgi:D-alanine-D-alanine ligase